MLGPRVDSWLGREARTGMPTGRIASYATAALKTRHGTLRVLDTGHTRRSCVVLVPDGPNVLEHYEEIIARLAPHVRVVCFDMPGFGFSAPSQSYGHTLDEGAGAVLDVLTALQVPRATLAFSCANGFYALRAARLAPKRIESLFLSQTPSLHAMHAWAARMIPRPLRVPVVGQLLGRLTRKQLARHWYELALPRGVDREAMRQPSLHALRGGACFSLAGVAQGLLCGSASDVADVALPCSMLWGARDRTHKHTDPASLRDCASGARIETLAECGHFPDLEQPHGFAERLLAQVGSITSA